MRKFFNKNKKLIISISIIILSASFTNVIYNFGKFSNLVILSFLFSGLFLYLNKKHILKLPNLLLSIQSSLLTIFINLKLTVENESLFQKHKLKII
ncbi:MAG: hypothetical protein KDK36_08120, partial [Leptospiraceae bacterium]|nr:hypothetical protein [Leptospiraceae bacterium]